MPIRVYISAVTGDGVSPATAFRAVVVDLLTPSPNWTIHDCRVDSTQVAGEMLCWADVSEAQHAILAAAEGVTYAPFENGAGEVLAFNDPIGEIESAKRTAIQNTLESRHVPLQGLQLTDEIYVIIRRYLSRCRIRQYLAANDYTEFLDNAVSTIPANKRNAIRNRLESLGFDLSAITGSTTIRQALLILITQDNVAF